MNPLTNRKPIRFAALPTTALTVALIAGSAAAQQQDRQQDQRHMRQQQTDERAERAIASHAMSDKIVGEDVVDPRGESLGSIGDLVLDLRKGKAPYAVVAFGGTLGYNQETVAVPMHAFLWDQREERFVLNSTRDKLESAPDFDEDDLDIISDEGWIESTRELFGMDREESDQDRGEDARVICK